MEKIFDKSMKGHSRVIWNCCWINSETFATAGRDKQLITWRLSDGEWVKSSSLTSDQPLTAVDCVRIEDDEESLVLLGKEDGTLELYKSDKGELKLGMNGGKFMKYVAVFQSRRCRKTKDIMALCRKFASEIVQWWQHAARIIKSSSFPFESYFDFSKALTHLVKLLFELIVFPSIKATPDTHVTSVAHVIFLEC